jgi:hypothetical protein
MKEILPGIFQSQIDKPFFSGLATVSYLALRPAGNLLFYSNSKIEQDFPFIEKKGKLLCHLLAHRHEAGPSCEKVRHRFSAPLFCHEAESDYVNRHCPVEQTFSGRQKIFDDLEIIPTPTPTEGSCCFLLSQNNKNILFTGDTLFPVHDEWTYGVGRQKVDSMIKTLEDLSTLDVHAMIPGLFIGNKQYEVFNSVEQYRSVIADCLAKLQVRAAR